MIACRAICLDESDASGPGTFDLTVSAGEVCTIVGPSGSGKTRLCHLLTGRGRPSSGRITVDGRNVADSPEAIATRVTHVVPEAPVWPTRSTTSNVEYVLSLCGLPRPHAEDVTLALRLSEVPDRLFAASPATLSPFHRYGVWLAIHRLRQVPVLVLDDPFLKLTGWEAESLVRLVHEGIGHAGCAVITTGSADVSAAATGPRYRIVRGQLTPIPPLSSRGHLA